MKTQTIRVSANEPWILLHILYKKQEIQHKSRIASMNLKKLDLLSTTCYEKKNGDLRLVMERQMGIRLKMQRRAMTTPTLITEAITSHIFVRCVINCICHQKIGRQRLLTATMVTAVIV